MVSFLNLIKRTHQCTNLCSVLKDAVGQLTGGRGTVNCWLWLAGGRLWWRLGLMAGMWLGGQLLVSCGAGGCNCLCIGGGPAGWVEPHCTGVRALSPVGLLSQALSTEEKTGSCLLGPVCFFSRHYQLFFCFYFYFLPVTIKAHVSMRRPAGRQVFRRTGLSLYFADRRSMTYHCKQPIAVVSLVSKVPSSVIILRESRRLYS